MGQARKSRSNNGSPLAPLSGRSLPLFDLAEYELDPKNPLTVENGCFVWNVNRVLEPDHCPADCAKTDCPNRDKLHTNGTRKATPTHVSQARVPQKIRINVWRWFTTCGLKEREVFPSLPHPGVSPTHDMTTAAVDWVVEQLAECESPKEIAKDFRGTVSEANIYRIKDEFIPKPLWPVTLCINPAMRCFRIDDLQIGETYYTLLLDATHNSFIGLIKGRSAEEVGPALEAIRARCTILRATIDFGD